MCQLVLEDATYRKSVESSIRVIVTSDSVNAPHSRIRDSLRYKIPVYFGSPELDLFDKDLFEQSSGFTLDDAEKKPDQSIRYAICGKVLAGSSRTAAFNPTWCYVSHLWGVNYESTETYDYLKYATDQGRIKRKAHSRLINEMMKLVLASALYAKTSAQSDAVHVLMPLVGLGAFMGEIVEEDQFWARNVFVTSLSQLLLQDSMTGVTVHVFDPVGILKPFVEHRHSRFKIHHGKQSDIFAAAAHLLNKVDCLCVINSWDNVSWIGNGGHVDLSIDGMLVGGAAGGIKFPNSSYLHNTFVTPSSLSSTHWISSTQLICSNSTSVDIGQ
jgi:hypothetical protein